jgi:hypothetical protein
MQEFKNKNIFLKEIAIALIRENFIQNCSCATV